MAIKKNIDRPSEQGGVRKSTRISKKSETVTPTIETVDKKKLKKIFSVIDILKPKNMLLNVKDAPIALNSPYTNYLQLLEVKGKDIGSLSAKERDITISEYSDWLEAFSDPITFEVTNLPTDTSSQIEELKRILDEVNREMLNQGLSRSRLAQLKDRAEVLSENIMREEQVMEFLYNIEFVLWLFSDSIEDLQRQVRQVQHNSYGGFKVSVMAVEKKEQVIKQYYNQNDKV